MNRAIIFAGLVAGTLIVAAAASWVRLPKPPPEAPRVHPDTLRPPRVVPDTGGRWLR